jgi:hypothetical protein
MSTNSTPTHAGAARQLPIVTINGKRYYRDDRLGEYRAVNNPHDRLPLIDEAGARHNP